jgi:ribonuclease PH
MRPSKRALDEIRSIEIETNVNAYAEGSALVRYGNTKVLCTASVEDRVPPFLRNHGTGWVSGEYNMLARSTHSRINKDPFKINGRNIEIKRLIGRSLRAAIDPVRLGERQISIDCDVLQADGGTRCAAITGGYVALVLAIRKMLKNKIIKNDPLINQVCAISCGIFGGEIIVDLDYNEDSKCNADYNFVLSKSYKLIEIQGISEVGEISFEQLTKMYELAKAASQEIFAIQNKALS